jgi:hypothetical protein
VATKVCCGFWSVDLILLFVALIELLVLQMSLLLFMKILNVALSLLDLKWVQKYWSMMGMIGHTSADPLGA